MHAGGEPRAGPVLVVTNVRNILSPALHVSTAHLRASAGPMRYATSTVAQPCGVRLPQRRAQPLRQTRARAAAGSLWLESVDDAGAQRVDVAHQHADSALDAMESLSWTATAAEARSWQASCLLVVSHTAGAASGALSPAVVARRALSCGAGSVTCCHRTASGCVCCAACVSANC